MLSSTDVDIWYRPAAARSWIVATYQALNDAEPVAIDDPDSGGFP
ncbi:MAG: hypothetical protein QNL12_06250 [Acidimicrobiia bacterium]|nr:hypothetical protein [Acidimicrobiia bacterium]